MLSRNCDGCTQIRFCKIRYASVRKGEFVYCEDGSRNLVDIEEEWLIQTQRRLR